MLLGANTSANDMWIQYYLQPATRMQQNGAVADISQLVTFTLASVIHRQDTTYC